MGFALLHHPRGQHRNDLDADRPKVRGFLVGNRQIVELGDIQKLVNQAPYAPHVISQGLGLLVFVHRRKTRFKNGQRRTQLVRGIGRELPLDLKPPLKPVQTRVHGANKRQDFLWHAGLG